MFVVNKVSKYCIEAAVGSADRTHSVCGCYYQLLHGALCFASWRTMFQKMKKSDGITKSALKIAFWLRMCKEARDPSIQGPCWTTMIHMLGSAFQANSLRCTFPQWVHGWWWGGHSMALEGLEGSSCPLLFNLSHYFEVYCIWNVSVFQQSCFYREMWENLQLSSSWEPGVQGYWNASL